MGTTLLSLIGRGKKDDTGRTYARIDYAIEGKTCTSSFFVDAVLQSTWGRDVDEVIICGTRTSSWGALLTDLTDDNSDAFIGLFNRVEEATEAVGGSPAVGASDEMLERLSERLSAVWKRRVRCKALAQAEIDDSSAPAVAGFFLSLLPLDDSKRSIALDITHGFRTLPLLALATVQLGDALAPGLLARTRILYGELAGPRARGLAFVQLQELAAVADSIRRFDDTLDGIDLAERIRPHSGALADAVDDFSSLVATNALRRLAESRRRLKNAVADEAPGDPLWMQLVRRRLGALVTSLGDEEGAAQLLALARWRASRGQTALAILTLWECASRLAAPEPLASYDAFKEQLREWRRSLAWADERELANLEWLRNQVAHGANLLEQRNLSARSVREGYARGEQLLQRLISQRP